ncbi:hybrid sensor histidine kinase/response regulator [Candidatus Endoriftia persephonae]|uniref:histidine kinase n=1 Tax=Candidatus Endoriftia persephonae TaxID=393765 RepID=A0A9J6ZYT6_9GAMM|nr:PAS domain-containing sensor histidine kinase [Candidatus Endoriftia persephone]USF88035.1 PAS domain S-box protein [Candidatus Endoriftia persephone]
MTKTSHSPLRTIVIVTLIVVAAMAILAASSAVALRIANKSAPLIDASMEVKYELSLFHLWFEELVQQDPTVDKEQVWQHLNQARWYANTMLQGGESSHVKFQALDDPALRSMIRNTLDQIDRLEAVGLARLKRAQSSLAGSNQDQLFDKVFAEVLKIADDVETAVYRNMATQIRQFERLVYILGAVVMLVGLAGGILFFLIERRRRSDYTLLQESETRFRRLFENTAAISVQGYDRNRRVIYWNPASEALYGFTADEAIGQQLEDLIIPGEMREGMIAAIDAWIDDGTEIPSSEITLRRADGSPIQVFSNHVMLRTHNNEPEMYCIDIDLTERKRAEAQARQHELVLNSVFQALPDLFFLMDQDGTIRDYRAPQAADLYVPPETFLGKRMQDVLPPTLAAQFNENRAVVSERGGLTTYEYTLELPHGLRLFEARLSQLPDSPQLIAVIRDITERRRAEEALAKSAQEWTHAMDFFEDAIYLIDLDDKLVRANQAFYKLTGLTPELAIGMEITSIIHPQKEAEPCPVCAARIARSDKYITMEANHPHNPTGRPIEVMVRTIRDDTGSPLGVLMGMHDLTRARQAQQALRESEERYRTIFEGAPEGVWLIGPDHRTLEVNQRLCEMLGYRADEMIGRTPLDFADEENQKIFRGQAAKIETTDRRNYEVELRHRDGHNIPAHFNAITLHTDKGGVLASVAFVTDLTEQKITEQALRRAQKMDAIGQLTGGIAHDFNNLLGIIIGNLDFLKRLLPEDDKSLKRVESASKAALRAADLTRQLLGFSRKQAQEARPTNINQVIRDMDSLIARSVTPEVEVELQLADHPWLTRIDPGDLEDALLNLILNARDAMPQGGKLTIETANKRLDKTYAGLNPAITPGDYLQLAVSDTGSGIPKEILEQIFEPFFTTKPSDKGTGLGLSMVYGFARRSNGYVKAYSEPGIGTTIRIYLPRSIEKSEMIPQTSISETRLTPGHGTILVVDDEDNLLDLARDYLEETGYKVHTATRATEALALLESEDDINLLFSDVVMPGGMNGYELAEQAYKLYPNLKILLTSGFTKKVAARHSQAHFAANLLSKPYSRDDLIKRIQDVLDGE